MVGATLASADFGATHSGIELVCVPSQPLACTFAAGAYASGESVESWDLGNTPLLAHGRDLFSEAGLEQDQPLASDSTANTPALVEPLRVVPAAEDEEAPEAPESARERTNAILRAVVRSHPPQHKFRGATQAAYDKYREPRTKAWAMAWMQTDRMNSCIVDKAWKFDFDVFQDTYLNKSGKQVDSVAYALDLAIKAKHDLMEQLQRLPSDNPWRSADSLPDTDSQGERTIDPAQFQSRWGGDFWPLVFHLIKKHEGEVVEVAGAWREMTDARATSGSFFMHKQFATSAEQSASMSRRFRKKPSGYIQHPSAVGDTSMFKTDGTRLCHREGRAFSLPEMLLAWGDVFTCQQLYLFTATGPFSSARETTQRLALSAVQQQISAVQTLVTRASGICSR